MGVMIKETRNEAGELHSFNDEPSLELNNGIKYWHQNGFLHRFDAPAIEYPDGLICWYQNGKFHSLDGPAIEYPNGAKEWYQNGELHRLDGPAVECADGSKEYWIEGKELSEELVNAIRAEAIRDAASKCNPMLATDDHRDQLFAYADKIERGER